MTVGAAWGESKGVHVWHRLSSLAHGEHRALCGHWLMVVHVYECDPAAGESATPAAGYTCKTCVKRLQETE